MLQRFSSSLVRRVASLLKVGLRQSISTPGIGREYQIQAPIGTRFAGRNTLPEAIIRLPCKRHYRSRQGSQCHTKRDNRDDNSGDDMRPRIHSALPLPSPIGRAPCSARDRCSSHGIQCAPPYMDADHSLDTALPCICRSRPVLPYCRMALDLNTLDCAVLHSIWDGCARPNIAHARHV